MSSLYPILAVLGEKHWLHTLANRYPGKIRVEETNASVSQIKERVAKLKRRWKRLTRAHDYELLKHGIRKRDGQLVYPVIIVATEKAGKRYIAVY